MPAQYARLHKLRGPAFESRHMIDESGRLSIAAGSPHKAASLLTDGSLRPSIDRDQDGGATDESGQFRKWLNAPGAVCRMIGFQYDSRQDIAV